MDFQVFKESKVRRRTWGKEESSSKCFQVGIEDKDKNFRRISSQTLRQTADRHLKVYILGCWKEPRWRIGRTGGVVLHISKAHQVLANFRSGSKAKSDADKIIVVQAEAIPHYGPSCIATWPIGPVEGDQFHLPNWPQRRQGDMQSWIQSGASSWDSVLRVNGFSQCWHRNTPCQVQFDVQSESCEGHGNWELQGRKSVGTARCAAPACDAWRIPSESRGGYAIHSYIHSFYFFIIPTLHNDMILTVRCLPVRLFVMPNCIIRVWFGWASRTARLLCSNISRIIRKHSMVLLVDRRRLLHCHVQFGSLRE